VRRRPPSHVLIPLKTYDQVGNALQLRDGNVKTVTDKRGILTENDYDSLGRLVETRRMNADSILVRLLGNEYDDAGNQTATVDAESNRIEYLHSPRNLLVTTTYIDGIHDYTEHYPCPIGFVEFEVVGG
jgi:YD repeat-containing protein